MRALVFTLALVTSPVGAVVCEVACADHAAAGHHAAPVTETVAEDHHHHGAVAPAAAALFGGTALDRARATEVPPDVLNSSELSNPDANCALPSGQPATLRTGVTSGVNALTANLVAATVHLLDLERRRTGGPPVWPPPAPPLRSTIPLRI